MANGKTYGVNFPFVDSELGYYLDLSELSTQEIKSNLIHLLLTRKGSRYFLPDFGTRLYEYIFEPLDSPTFNSIEEEIRESVATYIPKLVLNSIRITPADEEEQNNLPTNATISEKIYAPGVKEYTAVVRIDYTITDGTFGTKDFVIINI